MSLFEQLLAKANERKSDISFDILFKFVYSLKKYGIPIPKTEIRKMLTDYFED